VTGVGPRPRRGQPSESRQLAGAKATGRSAGLGGWDFLAIRLPRIGFADTAEGPSRRGSDAVGQRR